MNTKDVFCIEQFVQTAILESLRNRSDKELSTLAQYIDSIEKQAQTTGKKPRFFPEFKRAVALTRALREELQALEAGYRVEPATPLQDSAELRFPAP